MKSLADHLQIWGFEGDFLVFADGSLGFALECVPADLSTWSDEEINGYSQRVSQFLNGLPTALDIQFVQDIVPGNDKTIEKHLRLGENAKSQTAKDLCIARADFFRSLDTSGDLPVHKLKIVVRRPLSKNLLDRPRLFSNERKFQQIAQSRLTLEIETLTRLLETLTESLSGLGINALQMKSEQVAEELYHQWNPSRKAPFLTYDPDEVRESLLFSDVGIDVSGFIVGNTSFRILSLKTLPDQTFSAMAVKLRELPFRSRLFATIHVPDQTKEIETLQTHRRVAYSMVVGKKSGVSDLESSAKLQDLEALLEQMIRDGEKVFHASFVVQLQSEDEMLIDQQVDQVISKFREMGGAECMAETLAAFEIFSQVALPNVRCKERVKRIKTSNLCDLIPLYGPWPGHSQPSILLRSRMGNLLSLSVFDESLSNAGQLISGGSGSGKSFMTNLILLQMMKENARVYFVDIGGSYKKLTENLGGQYLDLGVNSGLSVNPFDLAIGESEPSPSKIKFLVGLVELMTREEGSARISKIARSQVENLIQELYKNRPAPRLSDLRKSMLAHRDPEMKMFGQILGSWTGDTAYGKFLDRPTTVQFSRDVVAFDLKGLESYPDLQEVCLYIITDLIWREIQADRSVMKFVVFDECWKLLKDETGLNFIEEIFRTVRKYYCSAIAISQDLQDFLNSKISSALLPNCSIKWILMQNQADFSRMREAIGLNDNEIALIQSLRQKKGQYSEAFLAAGPQKRTIAVFQPTPLELWLATTDPRDLAKIEEIKAANTNISHIEVLKLLAAKYPQGVSAGEVIK